MLGGKWVDSRRNVCGPFASSASSWVLVQGLNLSYHNKETIIFTIDPYSGILN